jgi:hypothetical protein
LPSSERDGISFGRSVDLDRKLRQRVLVERAPDAETEIARRELEEIGFARKGPAFFFVSTVVATAGGQKRKQ